MKNHLPLIHPNSSCHMSRACLRTFRMYEERWGSELFSSLEAPSDSSWWMWRLPHQKWTGRKLCIRFHVRTVIQSTLERLAGHYRKKDNGAQICSKDWRQEEWSGSACMGWRTQGGLGRSKDPWVRTTIPEEKSPRSHLDKVDQQELKAGLWPCLDLASIFWMNIWHPPHFPFPPINHFNTAIINPRLYHQSLSISPYIRLVLCVFSTFSWWRSMDVSSCTIVAYFYAMLS